MARHAQVATVGFIALLTLAGAGHGTTAQAPSSDYFEDFEGLTDGWTHYGTHDTWQRGNPGHVQPYSGDVAWATHLDGTPPQSDAYLVSPVLLVEGPSQLTFHSLYSEWCFNKVAWVGITTDLGLTWTILEHLPCPHESWTLFEFDLFEYADSAIQVGFYYSKPSTGGGIGLHIDDVGVTNARPLPPVSPQDLEHLTENLADSPLPNAGADGVPDPSFQSGDYFEDFEDGGGGWIHAGLGDDWEHGHPQSVGPFSAYSGDNLWGTNLDGYRQTDAESFIQSPPIAVNQQPAPAENHIFLDFAYWFAMDGYYGSPELDDLVTVQVSQDLGATWVDVFVLDGPMFAWRTASISLDWVTGSEILVRFQLNSNHEEAWEGAYFDDVRVYTAT